MNMKAVLPVRRVDMAGMKGTQPVSLSDSPADNHQRSHLRPQVAFLGAGGHG
ncbi:hypothetical protein SAMN05421543_10885 [Alicyclobacillus macrosporangiidus]|uniref:Uncharacterized protein n=1 Tax=Alicyclobacillus macrosporangiidus TaxID=392015 RepID=A0A1I7J2R3_9BACL|nr:hypothetical protein SAMN05421543_10885 [Alicyclobacillus macrosporangiidus]